MTRVMTLGAPRIRVMLIASIGTALALTQGCSDPYGDVRAGLSPSERERFDRGARLAAPCAACHDLAGEAVKIGPHLSSLAGRRAGGLPGFAYSDAMRRSDFAWSARTLDAFLADPQRVVPGNRMVSPGVADAASRADLVFFLTRGGRSPAGGRGGAGGR